MKISELTPEQKALLLADIDPDKPQIIFNHTGNFTLDYFVEGEQFMRRKKRYDESYDAIIPLIQKLDGETKYNIGKLINWNFDATASKLCGAVLIATGKVES